MKKDETLIKGEDFLVDGVYKPFTLTIEKAEWGDRENEGGKKHGLIIHFAKAKKPFFAPLDQLNFRMIKAELGTIEPAELVGKKLTLIPVKGNWFGESNTLAIRVMVTGDKPRPRVGRKAFGESVVGLKVLIDGQ
jgi:hypothetical protein